MRRELGRPRWAICMLAATLAVTLFGAMTTIGSFSPPSSRPLAGSQPVDSPCSTPAWVAAWHASPVAVAGPEAAHGALGGRTLRLVIHPQVGGSELRLQLSNRYGRTPLRLGTVTAAVAGEGAALLTKLPVPVTFGAGKSSAIPPGTEALSDPVPLAVSRGERLAVSIFLPVQPDVLTEHVTAMQTSYLSQPGDHAAARSGAAFDKPITVWPVLVGAQVLAVPRTNAVMLVGDSITDGIGSGVDANARWSDRLGQRLVGSGGSRAMSVLNAGVSRNLLLADSGRATDGESPRSRLPWEAVGTPGVTDVVLQSGTNDIAADRSATDIVNGMIQFAEQARAGGLRVFLTTITPSRTGAHAEPKTVLVRQAVNEWVRSMGGQHADGVFDLAAAVADPANPSWLAQPFDSGDGLHLSEAGYRALADAVDIGRLSGSPCLADRK